MHGHLNEKIEIAFIRLRTKLTCKKNGDLDDKNEYRRFLDVSSAGATYMDTRSQEISNLRQWDKISDMS
jgi:hypothetical protein